MDYKIIALILITILFIYQIINKYFIFTAVSRPIPENVRDVYDITTYQKWAEYTSEKTQHKIYQELVSYAVFMLLIIFNVFAFVEKIAVDNVYVKANNKPIGIPLLNATTPLSLHLTIIFVSLSVTD